MVIKFALDLPPGGTPIRIVVGGGTTIKIGELAAQTATKERTIRHYENLGLVTARRQVNGYREFCDCDVHKVRFIKQARGLGFSIAQCQEVLKLSKQPNIGEAEFLERALMGILSVEDKEFELHAFRRDLEWLVKRACETDRARWPRLGR